MKNVKYTGLVFCGIALLLIGSSIGFVVGSNQTKCNTKTKDENKNINNIQYKVSLEASEDFSITADSYDDGKNVNLTLTSDKIYSYAIVDVKAYYSTGELFNESYHNFNLINKKDELLINLPVSKDDVDNIVVSVTTPEYDPNVVTYNKRALDFSVNKNGSNLEFSSENKLYSNLLMVSGYVLFYNEDKLVDTLPFSIENISKDANIAASITDTVKEYDEVKVHINEVL